MYTLVRIAVKKSARPRRAICERRDKDPLSGAILPSFLEEDKPCIGVETDGNRGSEQAPSLGISSASASQNLPGLHADKGKIGTHVVRGLQFRELSGERC